MRVWRASTFPTSASECPADRAQSRERVAPALATSAARVATLLHLGPGVAQRDRPVEREAVRRRLGVEAEIALPFELHRLAGPRARKRRFEPAIGQHFERTRVEISGEIRRIRLGASEQLIVETYLGPNGVCRQDPVKGCLYLAPVRGRIAVARCRVVATA